MSSFARVTQKGPLQGASRVFSRRCQTGLLKDRSGVTAVEFAIALPLLLVIIIGAIEFGRALKAKNDMNHTLGKAVRVVYLDTDKTESELETLIEESLIRYGAGAVTVDATQTTISGMPHMKIDVAFPMTLTIPFVNLSEVTLNVDTLAPLVSPLK